MNKNDRRTEAQAIAEANQATIVTMDEQVEFFGIRHTVPTLVNGIEGDSDGITYFEWDPESQRFEGFVSVR